MIDKEKIYALAENINENDNVELDNELKELLKTYKDGLFGIAQINTIAGNLEHNAQKAVKYIKHAQNIGLDAVIFPELTLTGFPILNTLEKYPVLIKDSYIWLKKIAEITNKTTAIIGFVSEKNNKSFAILGEGKILNIIEKSGMISINNKKYAITSAIDDAEEFTKENIDTMIVCSSSLNSAGQERLQRISKKYSLPIIYVNQVGATDSYSFDGLSRIYNKNGELFAQAKSFCEQLVIANLDKNLGKIYPNEPYKHSASNEFSLDYECDLEKTYKTVIQGIKDYFSKTGFKRAVLGLSGGLDSTVCAVLLTDALGAENVFGISMPSKITSNESKNDAQILAQNLGINFTTVPIKDMFDTTNNCFQKLFKDVEEKWNGRYKQSFTPDNIQARSRAMILWGISNEFDKCLTIATSDKSEAYVGYATINGDMSGGFAPIADITKTKLFALARWLNKNRTNKNAIPQNVIDKKPGAELAIDPKTGKALNAEDALMPYEFLDEIIWRLENKKETYDQMLNSKFLYEKNNNLSKEQKIEWLDKFYRRMANALYKRSILPPYVMIESNKKYFQPITSSINYKGLTEAEIEQKIIKW